jgi:type II secretory pathway component PulF
MPKFKVDIPDAQGVMRSYSVDGSDEADAIAKVKAKGHSPAKIEQVAIPGPMRVAHGPAAEGTILRIFLYLTMIAGFVGGVVNPIGWIVFAVSLSGLACSASRE